MFTGIIETTGTVVSLRRDRLVISPHAPFKGLTAGESISVDGVCLTVERLAAQEVTFRLLPETARVSTVGSLRAGDRVNLERSLRVGDRLGGHLLLGHVDGQGSIVARTAKGTSLTLTIRIPDDLGPYVVPKGPIGVDGISLTLDATVKRQRIQVHLVAHTLKSSGLGKKPVGSRVNLEVDLIAKYLFRVL